jgi:SM-20-related protein
MQQGKLLLPPYRIIKDFLSDALAQELLAYALAHEHAFQPARTRAGYDPMVRISQRLYFGMELKQKLSDRILPLSADFIEALGVSRFEPEGVELELVAHGDGAFYSRHIDTFTAEAAASESGRQRLISAVLYLHRSPKVFSGGALRLYALGRTDTVADFVDIEPQHNSLVVFPSWAPHSVERVSCPSGVFNDSRFAINAWLWRKKPG